PSGGVAAPAGGWPGPGAAPPSGPGPGSAASSGGAPGAGRTSSGRSYKSSKGNRPRPVAGRPSPLFFGDVLEHALVEQELGDEELEALDLGLELAGAAGVVDLGGVVALPPAVVGVLGDAVLAADVADRQAASQVTVGLAQEVYDLLGGPSLAHESLLDLS